MRVDFFGPRVNCEQAPLFPAWAAAWVLDDPRKIPYLLVWKNPQSAVVQEAVRVAPYTVPGTMNSTDWIEVKRTPGYRSLLQTITRQLPRNGGRARLVICPGCSNPRRALYGWRLDPRYRHAVFISHWECRSCAGLRYGSEGATYSGMARLFKQVFGPRPRPEPWLPYLFSSPAAAASAGVCEHILAGVN